LGHVLVGLELASLWANSFYMSLSRVTCCA